MEQALLLLRAKTVGRRYLSMIGLLAWWYVITLLSSLFPEVIAVEFDEVLFSTSTNVIIVVAYISCSELPPAKKFVDTITKRNWRLFLSFFALSVWQVFKYLCIVMSMGMS